MKSESLLLGMHAVVLLTVSAQGMWAALGQVHLQVCFDEPHVTKSKVQDTLHTMDQRFRPVQHSYAHVAVHMCMRVSSNRHVACVFNTCTVNPDGEPTWLLRRFIYASDVVQRARRAWQAGHAAQDPS